MSSLRDGYPFTAATECGNLDLGAESRLCEGDRYLAVEIVTFSGEEVVILYSYLDNKVTVRTAVSDRKSVV